MNDLNSDEKGKSGCCSEGPPPSCCSPADGRASSCCCPEDASWRKGKLLISMIVIMAAIAVGASSFLSGNSAKSYTTLPAKTFFAGLTEIPTATAEKSNPSKAQTKLAAISVHRPLDSLQALDTLATDKDVVFLVLPGQAQMPRATIPTQVREVANNLSKSGQRVAVFSLRSGTADHNRLVRHFSVTNFPCVVVLGRQGTALAVSGGITEARLYNAFILVSKRASCCPGQSNPSCCPK